MVMLRSMCVSLFPSASEAASIWIPEAFYGDKGYCFRLIYKAELAQPRAFWDFSVSDCHSWKAPDIIVAAIAVLDNANTVCHDDSVIFAGGRPGDHHGVLSFRKLHRHTKRNNLELQRFKNDILCGIKVNPLPIGNGDRIPMSIDKNFHI